MVAVQDIECVLAQGNYVELRIDGRGVLVRETLAHILARLDPKRFARIHRSRIVCIDRIDQVEPVASGQYMLELVASCCDVSTVIPTVPCSRAGRILRGVRGRRTETRGFARHHGTVHATRGVKGVFTRHR